MVDISLGGGGCIQMYPLRQKGDHVFEIMYLHLGYIPLQLRRNFTQSWNWKKSASFHCYRRDDAHSFFLR